MKSKSIFLASSIFTVGLLASGAASARLEACGGVFLSGDAHCEFVRDQDCETRCEVTSVETACVASLQSSCDSMCQASAQTQCSQTCEPSCTEECSKVDKPSSQGLCRSECADDCQAKCEGSDNHGRCMACCQQNCNVRCDDHCRSDDTAEVCETKCSPVCTDRCVAEANSSCQIDCQTREFESCQTTTVETCQKDCHDTGGAIFCDGQFLNVTNLKDCAAELASQLSIKVDVNLDVDVDVHDDSSVSVTRDGKKHTAKCSVSAPGTPTSESELGAVIALGAFGAIVRRSRRRRG